MIHFAWFELIYRLNLFIIRNLHILYQNFLAVQGKVYVCSSVISFSPDPISYDKTSGESEDYVCHILVHY